jgi:hypothetical protein
MAKSSRAITNTVSTPGFEALVLEELEDVVLQVCSEGYHHIYGTSASLRASSCCLITTTKCARRSEADEADTDMLPGRVLQAR